LRKQLADVFLGNRQIDAFRDGVIDIIITIMALEMKVSRAAAGADLVAAGSVFLSFLHIGIYWKKRHLLEHAAKCVKRVNG
jgi:uncharacterized membrane protein